MTQTRQITKDNAYDAVSPDDFQAMMNTEPFVMWAANCCGAEKSREGSLKFAPFTAVAGSRDMGRWPGCPY